MQDKILEAYEKMLDEVVNTKDPTNERKSFVNMVVGRAITLEKWGVLTTVERKKIDDALTKIVKY